MKRPDTLPVFAVAAMFRASADLKAILTSLVAITAARTAGAVVMDAQLYFAERAFGLDD